MKLEPRPKNKRGRAAEILHTEPPVKSEIFDPRLDLPPGALERIKAWVHQHPGSVQEARYLVQTAWIGWVDPAYQQAIQENTGVRDLEYNEFVDRRNGKRLQLASAPKDEAEDAKFKLTEKAAAYLDLADLLEAFPEVRNRIQAPEFADDFQEVSAYAVSSHVDGHSISIANRIQDLKTLIQVWPEHRAQIIQALAEGGQARQEWFVEQTEAEDSITHALATAANLVAVFPELRPLVEEVVKKRMPEIQTKLQEMHTELEENEWNFHGYQWFIKYLTIVGAESAFLDARGDLQVHLRPLGLGGNKQPLPARPLA